MVKLAALAYYPYERIIVDLVEFCHQLLLTNEGGSDREQAYRCFPYNFEPGKLLIELKERKNIIDSNHKLMPH